jgi:hypothetical protein
MNASDQLQSTAALSLAKDSAQHTLNMKLGGCLTVLNRKMPLHARYRNKVPRSCSP